MAEDGSPRDEVAEARSKRKQRGEDVSTDVNHGPDEEAKVYRLPHHPTMDGDKREKKSAPRIESMDSHPVTKARQSIHGEPLRKLERQTEQAKPLGGRRSFTEEEQDNGSDLTLVSSQEDDDLDALVRATQGDGEDESSAGVEEIGQIREELERINERLSLLNAKGTRHLGAPWHPWAFLMVIGALLVAFSDVYIRAGGHDGGGVDPSSYDSLGTLLLLGGFVGIILTGFRDRG